MNPKLGLSKWSETIRVRLIMLMLIGGVLIASLVTYVWLPRVKGIMIDQQEQQVGLQLDMIGDSILPFLIQGQFGAIYETLDRVKERNPSWIDISLERANGNHLYPLRPSGNELPDLGRTVTRQILLSDEVVANITASVDLTSVIGVLQRDAWKMGASLTSFFIAFLMIMVWLLDISVVRRLIHLTKAAQEVSAGNFQYPLPKTNNDEIGLLTESFDKMRHNIELTTLSLQKSQQQTEIALTAKTDFLARMSHELLTPLNGILPMAELLTLGESDPSKLAKLDTIRTSARHVLTTVEDILLITDAEDGHGETRVNQFQLSQLARSVDTILRPEALKKGLSFKVCIDRSVDTRIVADFAMIHRSLIAIGQNAIKFTETGHIRIDLAISRTGPENQLRLQAKVTDSGIGIHPDHHCSIFDRFFQVDSGSTRGKDGAGLGLSIADTLVRCMGGHIAVDSALGQGSKFLFDIPVELAN